MARTRRSEFDYQTYLASREWSLLREKVRDRSGGRCEHCFRAPQQAVHHLTYANIGHEKLHELLAVCNPCHEWLSGKSTENPLTESYSVTPAFNVEGLSPAHYFLPIDLDHEGHMLRVRSHFCQEVDCIWCKYVDPYWSLNLTDLWMRWPMSSRIDETH